MNDIVVPVPALTELQEKIIASARTQGHQVVDDGLALVAQRFDWREGEQIDTAAERMLMDLVRQLQS